MSFKIYTKTGDSGKTGLFGGKRVSKDNLRIEAYGTIDELNSHLGLLFGFLRSSRNSNLMLKAEPCLGQLSKIQSELFTLGSQLATPPEKNLSIAPIGKSSIDRLEQQIDLLDKSLDSLTSFILPSGVVATAQCHVCRTVARRAERAVVSLANEEQVDPLVLQYLNRLSDYLFTLARATAKWAGEKDIPWVPEAE